MASLCPETKFSKCTTTHGFEYSPNAPYRGYAREMPMENGTGSQLVGCATLNASVKQMVIHPHYSVLKMTDNTSPRIYNKNLKDIFENIPIQESFTLQIIHDDIDSLFLGLDLYAMQHAMKNVSRLRVFGLVTATVLKAILHADLHYLVLSPSAMVACPMSEVYASSPRLHSVW